MNRRLLAGWPIPAALLVAAHLYSTAVRPALERARRAEAEIAEHEAFLARWSWTREVEAEERAAARRAFREYLDDLSAGVRGTGVRLLRLEGAAEVPVFEVRIRGRYANLIRFLERFENAGLEVLAVRRSEDEGTLVADLRFKDER